MIRATDDQGRWDEKYNQCSTHEVGGADDDLVEYIANAPASGMALDVACGTGRNSFLMAEYGLDVVCMDISSRALGILKHYRIDDTVSKKIFPIQADLTRTALPDRVFDLIVVIRYLDRTAFSAYLDALKPGGLLFLKTFNQNYLKHKPEFNPDFLLTPGELLKQFGGLKIVQTNDNKRMKDLESFVVLRKLPADQERIRTTSLV